MKKMEIIRIRANSINASKRYRSNRNRLQTMRKDSLNNTEKSSEIIPNFGPRFLQNMYNADAAKDDSDDYPFSKYSTNRYEQVVRPQDNISERNLVRRVILKNTSLENSTNEKLTVGSSLYQNKEIAEDNPTIRLHKMILCKKLESKKKSEKMEKLEPYFKRVRTLIFLNYLKTPFMEPCKSKDCRPQSTLPENSFLREMRENGSQEMPSIKERLKPSTSQNNHQRYVRSYVDGKFSFKRQNLLKTKGLLQKLKISHIDPSKIQPVRSDLSRENTCRTVRRTISQNRDIKSPYAEIRTKILLPKSSNKITLKSSTKGFKNSFCDISSISPTPDPSRKSPSCSLSLKSTLKPKKLSKTHKNFPSVTRLPESLKFPKEVLLPHPTPKPHSTIHSPRSLTKVTQSPTHLQ
ncbi:unnamed protein product [Moneuplotes crassus]|uniref:Uncharacterized protein n=1 Tax=Euplotes crassus TaxID=5936 RepID=A0AAD1UJ76_EUPCR|nr:unnamed protein product [Moneuplotes crassus]